MLKYTLILNTSNPLVESINALDDGENKNKAIKYVYDLARLGQGSLSPEEINDFIKASAENLKGNL